MALIMSGVMSFCVSAFNAGFVTNIIFIWLKAWGFAFSIAFPIIYILSPIVHKLVSWLVDGKPK